MTRGPYVKGRQRREEILNATLRLLSEDGYRQTSFNAIARAIGTTTSTLVHYFGTREALLEAVITRWDTVSAESDHIAQFALEQWVQTVEHNVTIPGIIRLYSSFAAEAAPLDHPSHTFFTVRFERIHARITSGLREKIRRGLIESTIEPELTAKKLIALSDGLQLQWLFDGNLHMAAHLVEAIESLRAHPETPVLESPPA